MVAAIALVQTPLPKKAVLLAFALGAAKAIRPAGLEQCLLALFGGAEQLEKREQALSVLKLNHILFHGSLPCLRKLSPCTNLDRIFREVCDENWLRFLGNHEQNCETQDNSSSDNPESDEQRSEDAPETTCRDLLESRIPPACGVVSLLGARLKRFWKMGIHWLTTVRNLLLQPLTPVIIRMFCSDMQ